MSSVRRRANVRSEVQKPGAVVIYHVRPRKGSLNWITVKATGFAGCETAVAIECDARYGYKLARLDLFTFELDSISAL